MGVGRDAVGGVSIGGEVHMRRKGGWSRGWGVGR